MKTFCVHHPKLTDRKVILQKSLSALNIDTEWIELYPPEEINEQIIGIIKNKQEVSLYKKHYHCIKLQIENNYENILILEDDVILPNDFIQFQDRCMSEFNQLNGDIMFMGDCGGSHIKNITPQKFVYHEPHFGSRCAHCYVINIKAATILYDNSQIIDEPWDWKLASVIRNKNLISCYTHPSIKQGTNINIMKSSLR